MTEIEFHHAMLREIVRDLKLNTVNVQYVRGHSHARAYVRVKHQRRFGAAATAILILDHDTSTIIYTNDGARHVLSISDPDLTEKLIKIINRA